MKYPSTRTFISDNMGYPERELTDLTNFMIKADQELKSFFYGIEFEPSNEVLIRIFAKIRARK